MRRNGVPFAGIEVGSVPDLDANSVVAGRELLELERTVGSGSGACGDGRGRPRAGGRDDGGHYWLPGTGFED